MKTFPTLYQKTNTGAIQQWRIWVEDILLAGPITGGFIYVEHGQVNGKLQETRDLVSEGKNPGKANETTPVQQAEKEALAKWVKAKKKGYVESIEDAQAGIVDAVIEGGIEPMLAPNKSYPKDDLLEKSIVYPCFFQPKLDGMRCIAIIENGKCTMWSRTRKRINTVPHIVTSLEKALPGHHRIVLDGELYSHALKDRFEDLISILRDEKSAITQAEAERDRIPDEMIGSTQGLTYLDAEYHVYDCLHYQPDALPENVPQTDNVSSPFSARNIFVDLVLGNLPQDAPVKRVVTLRARSLSDLKAHYEQALVDGYEGGMARNADAPYETGRRSKHLQKMKEFQDAEFKIIGAEDGRGKDAGTVAKFICVTDEGKEFRCRLKATYVRRRALFNAPEEWRDKQLTVTFKRWTSDHIPYIPIGKTLRDYE